MKQNLIDTAEIEVIAGAGGRGAISFRREKSAPRGGPDGGAGGDGGSVILRTNPNINTLRYFAGRDRFEAGRGVAGSKRQRSGEDGEDVVLEIPVGVVVRVEVTNYRLLRGRKMYGEGAEELKHSGMRLDKVEHLTLGQRFELGEDEAVVDENISSKQRNRDNRYDGSTEGEWVVVADMDKPEMELVMARGGRGGKGNEVYKSSRLTTPTFAQSGEMGERFHVRLELKVLADVGLVGLPNAGKSTLLSVLTAAKPEIADYPFTTLSPNLGIMEGKAKQLVIADIPGLIEDAHVGKGLGDEFLRHVERCEILLYVISPTEEMMMGEEKNMGKELWEQFLVVKKEVENYGEELRHKKYLVVINKVDLVVSSQKSVVRDYFTKKGEKVVMISAATTEGIDELKSGVTELLG